MKGFKREDDEVKIWTDPQLSIMIIYTYIVNFNPIDYDYIVR